MFARDQYELIDFGEGQKLERFGPYVLDRPSPAAEGFRPSNRSAWAEADARYERDSADRGRWSGCTPLPDAWTVAHDSTVLQVKRTEFGHLGIFPEQAANWDWLARQISAAGRPLQVLNLFAYTGGSTLAAAGAGARVVHVDASAGTVAWARKNAELSGLHEAPIRWITEDALKFVQREVRRGNVYDAVIADPPTYGHGPRGQPWQIDRHLDELVSLSNELTRGRPQFMLFTCHSPGVTPATLEAIASSQWPAQQGYRCAAGDMELATNDGRKLNAGVFLRVGAASAD